MKDFKIVIIIPAFNEEASILKTYDSIVKYNTENNTNYDVIVINDGSRDNTEKLCLENGIPIVSLVHNLGIGGAVQTGYKFAKEAGYDIAVQFDGDGQHDASYIKAIVDPIINGNADLVIGSRFVDKTLDTFKSSKARRMGIRLISALIKLVTGRKIFDTTSGFRATSRKVLEDFAISYPAEYPEPITTVEVLKKKLKVVEIPAEMNERQGGASSIHTWKNMYYMFNITISILIAGVRRYE